MCENCHFFWLWIMMQKILDFRALMPSSKAHTKENDYHETYFEPVYFMMPFLEMMTQTLRQAQASLSLKKVEPTPFIFLFASQFSGFLPQLKCAFCFSTFLFSSLPSINFLFEKNSSERPPVTRIQSKILLEGFFLKCLFIRLDHAISHRPSSLCFLEWAKYLLTKPHMHLRALDNWNFRIAPSIHVISNCEMNF